MSRPSIVVAIAMLAAAPCAAQSTAVTVTLTEWKVGLSRDTVRAGNQTFRINNGGTVNHTFYVRGEGVDKGSRDIAPKQQATLTVSLKPGTYEVFCSMSDESHKNAGMKGSLVVLPAEAAPAAKKP